MWSRLRLSVCFLRCRSGPGDNGSEWMKHWVKGGHNYYYNTQTGEGTWVEPAEFLQNNTQLNKDEIQVRLSSPPDAQHFFVVKAFSGSFKQLFSSLLFSLLPNQSVVSGVTTAYNREQLWLANESLITKLQARCRGYLVRKAHRDRMDFLKSQESSVTCIQVKYPLPPGGGACLPSQEPAQSHAISCLCNGNVM